MIFPSCFLINLICFQSIMTQTLISTSKFKRNWLVDKNDHFCQPSPYNLIGWWGCCSKPEKDVGDTKGKFVLDKNRVIEIGVFVAKGEFLRFQTRLFSICLIDLQDQVGDTKFLPPIEWLKNTYFKRENYPLCPSSLLTTYDYLFSYTHPHLFSMPLPKLSHKAVVHIRFKAEQYFYLLYCSYYICEAIFKNVENMDL